MLFFNLYMDCCHSKFISKIILVLWRLMSGQKTSSLFLSKKLLFELLFTKGFIYGILTIVFLSIPMAMVASVESPFTIYLSATQSYRSRGEWCWWCCCWWCCCWWWCCWWWCWECPRSPDSPGWLVAARRKLLAPVWSDLIDGRHSRHLSSVWPQWN